MAFELITALLMVGVLLLLAEIFAPGWVLGTIGVLLLLLGLAAGFQRDVMVGSWFLLGTLICGLGGFWVCIRLFPRTAAGKRLILQRDGASWQGFRGENQAFLGREGIAYTDLHPSGFATIDGRRVDVVTRGEHIPACTRIRVLEVQGNRVVVTATGAHGVESTATQTVKGTDS